MKIARISSSDIASEFFTKCEEVFKAKYYGVNTIETKLEHIFKCSLYIFYKVITQKCFKD